MKNITKSICSPSACTRLICAKRKLLYTAIEGKGEEKKSAKYLESCALCTITWWINSAYMKIVFANLLMHHSSCNRLEEIMCVFIYSLSFNLMDLIGKLSIQGVNRYVKYALRSEKKTTTF